MRVKVILTLSMRVKVILTLSMRVKVIPVRCRTKLDINVFILTSP